MDLIAETKIKKVLLRNLLESVKNCQTKYGSRTELATEDDETIFKICIAFEKVFNHGGKSTSQTNRSWTAGNFIQSNRTTTFAFWPTIQKILSKHESDRFLLLQHVRTDVGRGRAWLRAALNEHSLERYILILISYEHLNTHYEDYAFVRDHELNAILPQVAAGLGSIIFALSIDNFEFDSAESLEKNIASDPIAESVPELGEIADIVLGNNASANANSGKPLRRKKKKKIPTTFISFDGETNQEDSQDSFSSTSVPVTPSLSKEFQTRYTESNSKSNAAEMPVPEPTPSITIQPIEDTLLENSTQCSTSIKSDCLSIYSDTSDRINISLTLSPNERLKPIGVDLTCGESDPDRIHDLIPVSNYCEDLAGYGSEDDINSLSGRTSNEMSVPGAGTAFVNSAPQNSLNSMESTDTNSSNERILKLKAILDHEVKQVSNLKSELDEVKRKHNDECKILQAKIESLSKENEIIKHQLKKYIGAVQLLKGGVGRRGSLEEDEIVEVDGNAIDADPETDSLQYERKLIQVAEMHGELLEFNSYLQCELKKKDQQVKILTEELIDLRGPFEEEDLDGPSAQPAINTQGEINRVSFNERILINVWIPSVFLTGATNDLHHVYQIFIRIKDAEWNVYRRYSQFYNLHRDLRKRDSAVGAFHFPPKKHLGNKDSKYVEDRRRKLQEYLRSVINHTLHTNPILSSHPDKNLLISILPFLGEVQQPKPSKTRRRFFQTNTNEESSNARGFTEIGAYTGL